MPDLPPTPIGDGYLVTGAYDNLYGMEHQAAVDRLVELLYQDGAVDEEFCRHLRSSPLGRARVWKIYEAGRQHERSVRRSSDGSAGSDITDEVRRRQRRFDQLEIA